MQHLDAEIPSQVLEMYLGLEPWSAGYFRVVKGARINTGLRLCRISAFWENPAERERRYPLPPNLFISNPQSHNPKRLQTIENTGFIVSLVFKINLYFNLTRGCDCSRMRMSNFINFLHRSRV